jgi:N-acetylmuramoyl-L-alanine amidase
MDTRAYRPAPPPVKRPPVVTERPFDPVRPIGPVTIVIDPGHGGKDPGARGMSRVPEKEIVLAVGNDVARLLSACGARVISTRTDDRFIELDTRAAIAQRSRADLFVSIHADAASRKSATGATIYIARSASRQSRQAARCIADAFARAGIQCRGIRRAGFRVLVGHSRPAVLIECGYLTNRVEARRLNSPAYLSQLASVITDGIATFFES